MSLNEHAKNIVMKHFPFETAREGQAEIIWDCLRAFWMKKKFVVLEAPTGVGKSPIGMTVGKMIAENIQQTFQAKYPGVTDQKFGSVILTRTRSLQQQYEREDGTAVLWGKTHYSDVDEENPPEKVHTCGKGCPGMTYEHKFFECPYMIAKTAFFNPANVGIANNALFLSSYPVQTYPKVLVVDECHTFVDNLIDYSEIYVNTKQIKRIMTKYHVNHMDFIDECINFEEDLTEGRLVLRKIEPYLINLKDFVKYTVIPPVEETLANLEKFANDNAQTRKRKKQVEKELKFLSNFNEKLTMSVESTYARGSWICWKEVGEQWNKDLGRKEEVCKIYLKPMDPLPEVVDYIMGDIPFTLFMSATVGSYDQFCEEMGLNPAEGIDLRAPAIFKPENRPVYPLSVAPMNYSNREDLLSADGDFTCMVRSIMNQHKEERGVVHSVSYANAELLKKNIGLPEMARLVVVPRGTVVNESYIKTLPSDAVIISPSIAEGVDLKDDLARFQIILKIPFGSLGDLWIKAKLNRSNDWYSNQAAVIVQQMIGRVCRTPEDFGATYILDSNFERIKKLMPHYIQEAFY